MKKVKTIYYNQDNEIMFREDNFVCESPVIGDWFKWHGYSWAVENRNHNFDNATFEIFCKQV